MKYIFLILISLPLISLSVDPWDSYDIYILAVQWGSTMCLTSGQTCYEKMKQIPRHSMSIHGLWHSLSTGVTLPDCNSGSEIAIIDSGSDTFLSMRQYWPSLTGTNEKFWNHEYNKHGYCYLKKFKYASKLRNLLHHEYLNDRIYLSSSGNVVHICLNPRFGLEFYEYAEKYKIISN